MLNRWGCRDTEAGTGADALLQYNENCPDLIVSDWMMPGMTGLEVCLQLRAMNAPELTKDMLTGARLYTGPMCTLAKAATPEPSLVWSALLPAAPVQTTRAFETRVLCPQTSNTTRCSAARPRTCRSSSPR